MFRERGVEIKTPAQIERMRAAGLVVGETLELLRRTIRPGMTTLDLDRIAEDNIRAFVDDPARASPQGSHSPITSFCRNASSN